MVDGWPLGQSRGLALSIPIQQKLTRSPSPYNTCESIFVAGHLRVTIAKSLYRFIGIIAAGVLFVPETASFYLKQDKEEEAKRALIKLHGSSRMDIVEQDLERAKLSRELDNRFSHAGLTVGPLEPFRKPHLKRTLICCAALGFGQLAGASFVTTYLTYFL